MTPRDLFYHLAMFFTNRQFGLYLKDANTGEWTQYYEPSAFLDAVMEESVAFMKFRDKDLEIKITGVTSQERASKALHDFEFNHPQLDMVVDQLLDYLYGIRNNRVNYP